jgi:Uma2 family endonuclease
MATGRRTATPKKRLITAEELLVMPDDGKFYELLDGVLLEMSPPGGMHSLITGKVFSALEAHARERNLGFVLVGDPGIVLRRNPDRVRAPDVCFIAASRLPGGVPSAYLDVVPDLIVEIVSPSDRASQVEQKIEEWIGAGAGLVWAIYPDTRSIVAYQNLEHVGVYNDGETITGLPVLPDFATPVSSFFA